MLFFLLLCVFVGFILSFLGRFGLVLYPLSWTYGRRDRRKNSFDCRVPSFFCVCVVFFSLSSFSSFFFFGFFLFFGQMICMIYIPTDNDLDLQGRTDRFMICMM